MSTVAHTRVIELPIRKIWEVMDDFGNVARWHYNAADSSLLSTNNRGLGATRKVRMNDGTEVVERLVAYEEGLYVKAEVVEHDLPLNSAFLIFRLRELAETSTEVTVEMEFVMKFGPLGWVIDKLVMAPSIRRSHRLALDGLERHIETGKAIGEDAHPVD